MMPYLAVQYVPVWITRGALASYGFGRTSVYLCSCSLQYLAVPHDFYSSFGCLLSNDLADPVFDGVGLAGFKRRAIALLLA